MATQTIDFTARQREEHAADEAIIQAGMGVFVEVGHALVRIRERKSYLLTHSTFDEYLADRWGLSYHYAWEVMAAAQAARLIEAQEGLPAPANARVAYELRPLLDEPKRLVAVWRSLIEDGGRPTAQTVRKAVRALRSRPREPQRTNAASKSSSPLSKRPSKCRAMKAICHRGSRASSDTPFSRQCANVLSLSNFLMCLPQSEAPVTSRGFSANTAASFAFPYSIGGFQGAHGAERGAQIRSATSLSAADPSLRCWTGENCMPKVMQCQSAVARR